VSNVSVDRLLELAEGCMGDALLSPELRLRGACLLGRQTLERCVAKALDAEGFSPDRMSFRTQLEVLRYLEGRWATATDASFAWSAMSRATHYHGYELARTQRRWSGG
jgi:hypothetical protein